MSSGDARLVARGTMQRRVETEEPLIKIGVTISLFVCTVSRPNVLNVAWS